MATKDAPGPAAGDKAPAFSMPTDGDGTAALKDYKGQPLVLYFHPAAPSRRSAFRSGFRISRRPGRPFWASRATR